MLSMKQTAIMLAGSASKLAKMLGISRAAVSMWDRIPPKQLKKIMEMKPEWAIHLTGEQVKNPLQSSSSDKLTNPQ